MKKPIQISIPTPCHENWDAMIPVDKGRFCASCQKTVIDFSKASDREIAAAYKKDANACGRFRADQLNRDLIVPQEKSSLWIAASAAVISFLGLGTHAVSAQTTSEKATTHTVSPDHNQTVPKTSAPKKIKGKVTDQQGKPLENAEVVNTTTKTNVYTDKKGYYNIIANIGDVIGIRKEGYINQVVVFDGKMEVITLEKIEPLLMILGGMG
ncbi:carboxypeptidase-like regulatory domain-containing protein [Flavobacterium suzhouense]|uniref:Carboxypeptidase-like regulatory domain-containing protein n=1 Tax=Flavobacterium suzhouense TaxID=1529638 RepID=A0ABW5NXQ5_9FLAO